MVDHRHVVIGFQGSGKTTYAAALWHLVDARAKGATTALSKGTHRGDFAYLEAIANSWERGYKVERTGVGTWRSITINLKSEAVEDEIELSFVDMSGETFEQIFTSREFDARIEAMAQGCEGLLLFVSAERTIDDATIADMGKAFPEEMPDEVEEPDDDDEFLDEVRFSTGADGAKTPLDDLAAPEPAAAPATQSPNAAGDAGAASVAKPGDFIPALTPRQVQIVDLLEAFSDAPVALRPKRVAVIVSAWDLAETNISPEAWLTKNMALLDQYLGSRQDEFETRIYGVSAQGGTLPKRGQADEGTDRQSLLAKPVASSRIRVVGHNAGEHDLTHPIAWLSGLER